MDLLRVLDLHQNELSDPEERWETPGVEADLRTYASLRRAAYPLLPAKFEGNLPDRAVADLEEAVGTLRPGDVVMVPRTPRPIPGGDWAVTPTSVLGIGADAVALWVDEPAACVVTSIPFRDVAAVLDLTVLLYGRLEIVGPQRSIVLRYNTVGRDEMRAMTLAVRRGFAAIAGTQVAGGPAPEDLPHKWMAVLKSREAQPRGREPRLVIAGNTQEREETVRNGVATLTTSELLIAVEPEVPGGVGMYGVDLVAVPRTRLASAEPGDRELIVDVAMAGGTVRLRVPAHPALASALAAAVRGAGR